MATTASPPSPDPGALDWVILKVAQRCNLDCTYCYVYNRGDDSWKTRPPIISSRVVEALAARIVEQAQKYHLEQFVIELHGGEPLLLGKRRTEELLRTLSERCTNVRLKFIMQTNGLLLDEEWLEIFERYGLTFGISLDGPPELADRVRLKVGGGPSTQELLDVIARLRAAGPLFDKLHSGFLCVVNPESDGAALVRWFAAQQAKGIDFLLPDGNYANRPAGWTGPGPYQKFLLDAFDAWFALDGAGPKVRTFETMLMGFLGVRATLDSLGGALQKLCVVESDGSIGVADTMRICGGRFAKDSLNVFEHALDEHAAHYELASVQELPGTCRACPYLSACGGGYLPHRFDGTGFDNPSIYCEALTALSERMYRLLLEHMPARTRPVQETA